MPYGCIYFSGGAPIFPMPAGMPAVPGGETDGKKVAATSISQVFAGPQKTQTLQNSTRQSANSKSQLISHNKQAAKKVKNNKSQQASHI
jgi:hypothetical protein